MTERTKANLKRAGLKTARSDEKIKMARIKKIERKSNKVAE